MTRKIRIVLLGIWLMMAVFVGIHGKAYAEGFKLVYVIPVQQDIEQGLFEFMERGFMEAEKNQADVIVLSIDTPGGEITAAGKIGELIRKEKIPVLAFIEDEAFSAGTYIALNADQIIMTPGSAMGAAAPIDLSGNTAGQKVVAAWTKKMTSAAEMNGRDPQIAEAMINPNIEIPGVTKKGELLSLDPSLAKKLGYSDFTANNLEDALQQTGYGDAQVILMKPSMGQMVARFVTNPFVMPILLTLGIAGIAIEFLIPGFGIPGVLGVLSFGLYFFGHYLAGFADLLHIFLFGIGILLLLIEMFVPGFGLFGGLGVISILSGIVMAAYNTTIGFISLGIALLIALVIIFFAIKYFGHRGVWNKFILKEQQKNEQGYTAPKDHKALIGKEGVARTPLRPAGTAELEGSFVDVVTEGIYIEKGSMIRVVKVEGTRVVVNEIKS